MKRARIAVAVMAMGFANVCAAEANIWWVDAENGVDATGRGTAADNAFQTLQYAHDAASAGDTINVLPGNYDSGEAVDSGQSHKNRLLVSKKLFFHSVGGKGAAHIVGQFDSTTGADGDGAVRGVCVNENGLGSEFHGFTIRNCAAGTGGDVGTGKTTGMGGGVLVYGDLAFSGTSKFKAYFVDCVFSNNVAKWGAAMRGGTVIRCLMSDNTGTSFGQTASAAALWNCVVRNNISRAAAADQRPVIGNGVVAVNTAFYSCLGYAGGRGAKFYNCALNLISNTELAHSWDNVLTVTNYNTYGRADGVYFFVAPATGDFRPLAGSAIVGGGLTSYLKNVITLPAGTEMKDYNGNPLDLTKETCDAGPVQGAVTVAGGGLFFNVGGPVEIEGVRNQYNGYVFAEVWPTQFKAVSLLSSGNFMRWKTSRSVFMYPQYDGSTYFFPPATPGKVLTNTAITASRILWASPDADASVADGSEARPYRTLQAAMDYIESNPGANTIVYAKPGEYAEGSMKYQDHFNRVVMPTASAVLLKSTHGAAVTTIRGLADSDAPYPDYFPGCGTNAMRCIATRATANYSQAVQGFTLADGHGCATNNSYAKDLISDRCGAVYGNGNSFTSFQILDCVFTNCAAVRGAAFYYARASRCLLTDCESYGGVTRYGFLVSSEVRPTCKLGSGPSGASMNAVMGTDTRLYFCTAPVGMAANLSQGAGKNSFLCCLFGNQAIGGAYYWGSVFKGATSINAAAEGHAIADPLFADQAEYDYRVPACSPARYAAQVPPRDSEAFAKYEEALVDFCSGGIDGGQVSCLNGVPMPGARQIFRSGAYAYVDNAAGNMTVAGASLGASEISEGTDVTLSPNGQATRPAAGCIVNGETVNFADLEGYSLTIPYAEILANGLHVAPIYSSEWFVDAVNGDDDDYGFVRTKPKKTLACALAAATAPGDIVHAAPGDYNTGAMRHAEAVATSPASRAVILPEVTLVSDEGSDVTFITGAAATSDDVDSYGCGSNAVRCAFLRPGAKLKGFTLRGGRVRSLLSGQSFDGHSSSRDWLGGGVLSPGFDTRSDVEATLVEDCVITNCVALVGGAGVGAIFRNCRMFKCRAVRGSAVEKVGLINTIVDDTDSSGSSGIAVNNLYVCVNVTVGSNIRRDSGGYGYGLYRQWSSDYGVTNTVVLSMTHSLTKAVNCVFNSGDGNVNVDGANMVNCRKESVASMALDERYRPDLATSVLVDAGTPVDAGATDVYGGQRIYNGAIDIGAVEADWRDGYRKLLKAGGLAVVSADPQVVTNDNAVLIRDGMLSATWANVRAPKSVQFVGTTQVTGNGTLTVSVDGETIRTLTAADGAVSLGLRTASPLTSWVFEYTPGENDTGGALLSDFSRQIGMTMNFR